MIEELRRLVYCNSGKPKAWNDSGNSCEGEYLRPTILPEAFPLSPSAYFWSGSSSAYSPSGAWYVSFSNGYSDGNIRSSSFSVRLVRSGQ